jgi:hypothetical protein
MGSTIRAVDPIRVVEVDGPLHATRMDPDGIGGSPRSWLDLIDAWTPARLVVPHAYSWILHRYMDPGGIWGSPRR